MNDDAETTGTEPARARAWALFPDASPPADVISGWRALLGLPTTAQRNLWLLLGPVLEDADDATLRSVLDAYCQRFQVNPGNVLAAARACDHLLRRAASLNVDEAAFRADLEALVPGSAAGLELLLPRYLEVRGLLQTRLLERTLAEHGNLLTGFDWRLDRVQTSNHGHMGDTSVLSLNLRYRRAGQEKQLALQLPAPMIQAFRQLWDQFSITE